MNHKTITNMTCLSVLLMIFGCVKSTNVDNEPVTEEVLGSHHVTVKPTCEITSSGGSFGPNHYEIHFLCGDVTVKIENQILIVNEISYGLLQDGQSIEVDHGKVSVAGRERTGTALKAKQN